MSAVSAPPASPYRGLAAFGDSELDALFFFGREREREVILANLLASRLTVLYGESGVGKSSLLAAAVVRDLRDAAPDAAVVLRSTWSGELDELSGPFAGVGEGYLILDQFEEYFLYHADDAEGGSLLRELPELLATTRVNVLISLREDALARLDVFKARIPGVFGNQVRLDHLDVEQARRAILGPLARWRELSGEHVDAEPALVEALVDDVAVGSGRVEAPYLQLVLERVWAAEREAGSRLLRRETLEQLGGAAAIVREQFRGALESLPADEQEVAAAMFEHLVTPTGTKIALRAVDLAEYARVPENMLRRVLDRLTRDRIVHAVDGSDRYEIFHDVLADPISAWRLERRIVQERAAAQRRQRRLLALAGVALLALAVVAALAVWAFSERGSARSQARQARAHELQARAVEQLAVDPRQSVSLAVASAQLEPSAVAEATLRQALIANRLRATLHVSAAVRSVATAPAGTTFAAVADPHTIVVGAAGTGRVTRRLHGAGPFATVGFAGPDTVVAATPRGLATAWSLRSGARVLAGARLAAARAHGGEIVLVPYRGALGRALRHSELAWATPGGSLVAAAVESRNGRVRAWVFDRAGRLLHVLPEIGIHAMDFSPDGRTLVTASALGDATIWNPRTGRRVRVFADSRRPLDTVAFSPDGTLLAGAGADGAVRVWTVRDGSRLFYFTGHTSPVEAVAWSPDGRIVASAARDRTVRLWGVEGLVEAGSPIATLAGAHDAVRSLAFTADGERLVSGSDDATVRVWDSSPEQELRVVTRFGKPVTGAVFAGRSIVAASADGTVRVVEAGTNRLVRSFHAGAPIASLAVSSDGSVVAAGTDVVDVRGLRLLPRAPGRAAAVALDASGGLAVAGGADGTVRAWRTRSGHVVWVSRQGSAVSDVAISPDGSAAAASDGRGATIRSAATGAALHRLTVPGGVVRLAFSPDGTLLATADADGTARLWFVGTGRAYRVLRGHRAALTDLAFSSDGVLLATSAQDADGRIWNVRTGRSVHVLRGHFGTVGSIALSPDRRWIATGGPISAGLWPMSTGRLLFYLRGDTELVTSISFSADGRTILSGSVDGTVRTYRCGVCGRLGDLERLARDELRKTR